MKLLTKEEEQAHYNATLKGGFIGGGAGLAIGAAGVAAASRRYQFFRQLTLPLKAFLITSGSTFGGIVTADHYSRAYERERNPIDQEFDQRQKERSQHASEGKTFTQRAMDFGKKERYKIVGASWIASMITAFAIVNRNKYLTGQQKLVQARVYAQFLTVGVLVATAVFEISDKSNDTGRYETIQVLDPNDPDHKRMIERKKQVDDRSGGANDDMWKDMVAAEEQRIKEREEDEKRLRDEKHKKNPKKEKKDDKKDEKKDEKKDNKDEGGDDKKKDEKSKGDDDQKQDEKKDEKKGDKKVPSANDAKEKK